MAAVQGYISEFHVAKMDCPAEERMIRMVLDDMEPGVALEFDLPARRLKVTHACPVAEVLKRLETLNYDTRLQGSRELSAAAMTTAANAFAERDADEARVLKWMLAINGVMFLLEVTVGIIGQSTALIADGVDMFADAAVYGLALFAVGRSARRKLTAAHTAGWLQLILAASVLVEVVRRFVYGSDPVSGLMMGMGLLALIANVSCLLLIHRQRHGGVHMQASWIFSAVDVLANTGVMLAGLLVLLTGSRYPDLVIGLVIVLIVLNGSRRILQLKVD